MKICVITGARAEYGLFYWLLKKFQEDPFFELQIIVTGAHLAPEFDNTYQLIEKDGFEISYKVEMLLASDTESAISKSVGIGFIGFSEAYSNLKPDVVLILGDRYELLPAAMTATIFKIPVAHMYGGETTEGAFDEVIRHSITKMSHIHFTANEEYRKRVIQLGEHPDTVFTVGSIGIENIKHAELHTLAELKESMKFEFQEKNILITFHPVTFESKTSQHHFNQVLEALNEFPDLGLIFTGANSDTDGRVINKMIENYVKNRANACYIHNLGRVRYLSVLNQIDFVLGNSSSALIEVPCFEIPTVNVGDRQKGRMRPISVIDVLPEKNDVSKGIQKALSAEFKQSIKGLKNPYGDGKVSEKIIEKLKNFNYHNIVMKKFYDL